MAKVPPDNPDDKEWSSPPLAASRDRQLYQSSTDPHAALRAQAQIAARRAARVKWMMRLLEEELLDETRAPTPNARRVQQLSDQLEPVWVAAEETSYSSSAVRKQIMLALFVGAKGDTKTLRETPEGLARRYFARSYPELAEVISDQLLQRGTDVWRRARGKPIGELAELPTRGQAVNDIMRALGFGKIGEKSVETEWYELQRELAQLIPNQ